MDKKEILREFSSDPGRHYNVELFASQGFTRRSCAKCKRYFWTTTDRDLCPDDGHDTYSFIGDPPTSKRFDYTESWKNVREFFVKNGHTAVNRYPVVCRWRDDLYFTIASIVDFQRVMGSKVVFEFPANPLVVPQTCLRFKDLENVGVTGRHFSSFCMIGQHSIPKGDGYWKDRCVELDYNLLTQQFGIDGDEIVFVEDVWAGGGSFGPSLEYFVRGLELGNAVFTEFQGELGRHTELDQKVIDMGAGLERFAWITTGTPTAYDCCFGPINQMLFDAIGVDSDSDILPRYYTEIARCIDSFDLNKVRQVGARNAQITDEQLARIITPLEGAYLIADHLRTLIFAISDGALPSNVGGGYNLRMMLRRIDATCSKLNIRLDTDGMVDAHIDYLMKTYPELDQRRQDVKEILKLESARYSETKVQIRQKADRIKKRGTPTADQLVTLYESDGITPEYLKEIGTIDEVPSSFYTKLAELHQSKEKSDRTVLPLDGIKETELLFYGNDPAEFDAKVLKVIDDMVVLDRTSFYARGGGQEPDHGTIAEFDVTDVQRHAGIIVHKLSGGTPRQGETVQCVIDASRRAKITKNHTSTHILNASSRNILGSWVWQHSAFKDEDHARLDITHHSPLSKEQVTKIERRANQIVQQDHPVEINEYERGQAEQKFGFRIYQGGVVPVKSVRIVSIPDIDVEACGGTHVKKTSEIEMIKITKVKKIQDGVVRLEFVSGHDALTYQRQQQQKVQADVQRADDREQMVQDRDAQKHRDMQKIPILLKEILGGSKESGGITTEKKVCFTESQDYGAYFYENFGKKLVKRNPEFAFCGIYQDGQTIRIRIHAGSNSGVDAGKVAGKVSKLLGGAGGGDAGFAQGGGRDTSKKDQAVDMARSMILGMKQ